VAGSASFTASIESSAGSAGLVGSTIGLNDFYSVPLGKVAKGITKVTVEVAGHTVRRFSVVGYADAAPVVRSLSPASGPLRGGTRVTLRGTGLAGATKVLFGSKGGSRLRRISGTEVSAVVPGGSGVVPVTVGTRRGGPSGLTRVARYGYASPLSTLRLSSASGPRAGGRTVKITGSGMAWARAVYFGSHRATRLRLLSARSLSMRVPAGSGTVAVKVVASGGTSSRLRYRYTKA
jgi:hypothetical protein